MAVLVLVSVVLLLIAVPLVVVNRDILFNRGGARRQIAEAPLPFLIFPVSIDGPAIVPAGLVQSKTSEAVAEPVSSFEDGSAVTSTIVNGSEPAQEPSADASASAHASAATPEPPWRWPRALSEEEYENSIAADATMVFNRPMDEPVQILPGRLRVLSGENTGQELRLFNRLGDPPRIVVGRDSGPLHQHITLRSPTVSRRHARMELVDGCWTITNLSATNPVLVNDSVLAKDGATRKLSDGDRIELGEVALRFLAS